MTPEAIELAFIREFSVGGLQIGKSPHKADRRERVRQAIYLSSKGAHKFYDTQWTYAEAFHACYGERIDRRAAMRELPEPEDSDDEEAGE
jgi:hypothetical protein